MTCDIKDIIDSVLNQTGDNGRIISPEKNAIYLFKTEGNEYIPVKVIDGQFYGKHGVSNFWTWINLNTNKKECGYGNFYTM